MALRKEAQVVARYRTGEVVKGRTNNFDPMKPDFTLYPLDAALAKEPTLIALQELKAIFFVRDFVGDPAYVEQKVFQQPRSGRKLEITFEDGEVLVGTSLGFDPVRPGFFLFPADPASNNERVYVVKSAVKGVRKL